MYCGDCVELGLYAYLIALILFDRFVVDFICLVDLFDFVDLVDWVDLGDSVDLADLVDLVCLVDDGELNELY